MRALIKKTGIEVSFVPATSPEPLSQPLALCLYRIIREGLQNIFKHSGTVEASITLRGLADGIHLVIQDKGVGFDPNAVKRKAGIGLSSMRERVRLMNGTIAFESSPGGGTVIKVIIPAGGRA